MDFHGFCIGFLALESISFLVGAQISIVVAWISVVIAWAPMVFAWISPGSAFFQRFRIAFLAFQRLNEGFAWMPLVSQDFLAYRLDFIAFACASVNGFP